MWILMGIHACGRLFIAIKIFKQPRFPLSAWKNNLWHFQKTEYCLDLKKQVNCQNVKTQGGLLNIKQRTLILYRWPLVLPLSTLAGFLQHVQQLSLESSPGPHLPHGTQAPHPPHPVHWGPHGHLRAAAELKIQALQNEERNRRFCKHQAHWSDKGSNSQAYLVLRKKPGTKRLCHWAAFVPNLLIDKANPRLQ